MAMIHKNELRLSGYLTSDYQFEDYFEKPGDKASSRHTRRKFAELGPTHFCREERKRFNGVQGNNIWPTQDYPQNAPIHEWEFPAKTGSLKW